MSDARPITNITDFVCGSCWNGFSRNDAGVLQGDQLICPHCGTPVPTEDPDDQLASAVRNAPHTADRDSSAFHGPSFRDTSDVSKSLQPDAQAAGKVWLPPEHGEGRAAADSDDFDLAFGDGVLVGDPDQGFEVAERTLSGHQDNDELLAAVRQTSPIPKAFIVGEELSVATEERTPVDDSAMDELQQATALADVVEERLPEADLAHRDWKLKAMGITYNFHGLDPLFSWAANKSGQPMSLSHDGEIWKDFHTFYASIRDGVSVKKAFEGAPDPSNAPPPPSTPRVTRTINQLRPELPELEGLRPPADPAKDIGPMRMPSTTAQQASRVASNPANPAGRSGVTGNTQALQGGSQPSGTMRAAAAGTTGRTQATVGPTTSPSKRMPVAAVQQKALTAPKVIAIVVVVLLVAAAALHLTGVFKIPGLP